MQDYNQPDRNHNPLHLIDSNSIQETVSDRRLIYGNWI